MTTFNPQYHSPIHATAVAAGAAFGDHHGWAVPTLFSDPATELTAARERVALADGEPVGKWTLEGADAVAALPATWNAADLAVGAGSAVATDTRLYRLRADLFLGLHPIAGAPPPVDQPGVTLTNITHGQTALQLLGPAAAALLSRLCALDFHPTALPDATAVYSSVAKTRQLIIRADISQLPAYFLIGPRSLAAYLWQTLLTAGRDLGLAPIGQATRHTLAGQFQP